MTRVQGRLCYEWIGKEKVSKAWPASHTPRFLMGSIWSCVILYWNGCLTCECPWILLREIVRFWLHSDGLVNSLLFVVILAPSSNRAVESTYICSAIFFKGNPPYPPASASFVLCFPGSTPDLPIEAPMDWRLSPNSLWPFGSTIPGQKSAGGWDKRNTEQGMNQKETLTLSRFFFDTLLKAPEPSGKLVSAWWVAFSGGARRRPKLWIRCRWEMRDLCCWNRGD